jgi:uncharacterized membrane protein
VIRIASRIGDFVPEGAPLLFVYANGEVVNDRVDWSRLVVEIAQDSERTMEQDLAFGFRQLVDIAERALSPSTDDPTTACQAIDVIHDLLRRLATRHLPTGGFHDTDGALRLVVPQYTFADFVDLAVREIWRYGSDSPQVPERLSVMLDDLSSAALPEHYPPLRKWTNTIRNTSAVVDQR